ncbi:hypothetical protein MMC24_002131 [Lignoscripta atroalba]|nr:hypothetical protein [Lignoscripta atroalba]
MRHLHVQCKVLRKASIRLKPTLGLYQRRYSTKAAGMHYGPGIKVDIQPHEAPSPTEDYYYYFTGEEYTRRRNATLPQLSHIYPPAEGGRTGPPITLEITDAIRTGPAYTSQLVKAKVPAVAGAQQSIVAKFYDPLLADDPAEPEKNTFWLADHEYALEVAAYGKLGSLYGTLVPKFYGAYTCMLPTGLGSGTRAIRLILLEFVEGIALTAFGEDVSSTLSQKARKNVMYKIVDADSRAYALGVNHRDVAPRNIILEVAPSHYPSPAINNSDSNSSLADNALRLRLLDFGVARIAPFEDNLPVRFGGQWEKAVSPILRWHVDHGLQEPFVEAGWVDWEWQSWVEECWGNSTVYEPITEDAVSAWVSPGGTGVFA